MKGVKILSLLQQRVAIVTGAGTGIGRETALRLAAEGALVVLVGRRKEKLEEVARQIEQKGGRSLVCPADVTNSEQVHNLKQLVMSQVDRVDILVNNAGGTGPYSLIHDMSYETWDHIIQLNLYSVFLMTNAFLPVMRSQQYGRIVAVTSSLATQNFESLGAYSAAKAGMEAFIRAVALEEGKHGILANLFDPGNLKTEQNPYGQDDPSTVIHKLVPLTYLPSDGPTGQTVRAY